MLFSPDNVADIHSVVVHDTGKVVSRQTIGFHNDKIIKLMEIKTDRASYYVLDSYLTGSRQLKADDMFLPLLQPPADFILG